MAQIGQLDTNILNYPELEEFSKQNPLDPVEAKVLPPSAYVTETIQEVLGGAERGLLLPWKQNGRKVGQPYQFRFRTQEVTIWAGSNGVGKSMLTSQIALWLAMQGEPCCLASFEMTPQKTIARLVRQMVGREKDPDRLVEAIYSLTSKIWIYDKQARADIEELHKLVHYVTQVHKVKHVFIDSLMMCVKDEDDYNGQKAVVEAMTQWCKTFDVHLHLVCHMRKGAKEATGYDTKDYIKGSSSITDLAFNVFTMRPNFDKLEERDEMNRIHDDEPDVELFLSKQRNGSWQGAIPLWFNKEYLSYCDSEAKRLPAMEIETPFED